MAEELIQTPFYDHHMKLGAKMVDFHGFYMPLQYSSIVEEHKWVRKSCGVFDVSHMGKFMLHGQGADDFLNFICPSKVADTPNGKIIYSAFLYEDGSPVDDVLLYKLSRESWLVVVNAANRSKVKDYIFQQKASFADPSFTFLDRTDSHLQLAIQGPKAKDIVAQYISTDAIDIDYYEFRTVDFMGRKLIISRTGYTGEDGFEVYGTFDKMAPLCGQLCQDDRVLPAGLGSRDSLRLETRFPLYGQELLPGRSILQSGLGWTINWDKGNFIGREVLAEQKENGEKSHLFAYQMVDAGIPRAGYEICDSEGNRLGVITSGGFSPTLEKGILIAWHDDPSRKADTVRIRNQLKRIERVKGTFVPNRTLGGKAGLKRES